MPATFSARCTAVGFQPDVLARDALSFTADDLAHALFVTGRAPGDRWSHGAASAWEWLHRTSVIPAYVRCNDSGRLVRSRLTAELDRSEKAVFSYALGQAVTAIYCEQMLSVTHLMHVDRYAARFSLQFGSTRTRADLFGRTSGREPDGWVVAEAKGRWNGMERALPPKLLAQKRSIKSIQGEVPTVVLGCVASFPPNDPVMRVDAVDPVENEPTAINLEVDSDRFLLAYYEPFLATLDLTSDRAFDGGEAVASFSPFGLEIGLRGDVHERVRAAADGEVEGLAEDIWAILNNVGAPGLTFPDGSIVRTDWDETLTSEDSVG